MAKSKTRIYRIWANMRNRCNNPNNPSYPDYGGRGITVAPEFQHFDKFEELMGPTYADDLTLDRIDPNGPYSYANCRWLTMLKQASNKRNTLYAEDPETGELLSLRDIADKYGRHYKHVYQRFVKGLDLIAKYSYPEDRDVLLDNRYNWVNSDVTAEVLDLLDNHCIPAVADMVDLPINIIKNMHYNPHFTYRKNDTHSFYIDDNLGFDIVSDKVKVTNPTTGRLISLRNLGYQHCIPIGTLKERYCKGWPLTKQVTIPDLKYYYLTPVTVHLIRNMLYLGYDIPTIAKKVDQTEQMVMNIRDNPMYRVRVIKRRYRK